MSIHLIKKESNLFVKTITHYYVGKVREITPTHVVLDDASEVYETGDLDLFYNHGKIKTSERVPNGFAVNLLGSCFVEWNNPLPMTSQGINR